MAWGGGATPPRVARVARVSDDGGKKVLPAFRAQQLPPEMLRHSTKRLVLCKSALRSPEFFAASAASLENSSVLNGKVGSFVAARSG